MTTMTKKPAFLATFCTIVMAAVMAVASSAFAADAKMTPAGTFVQKLGDTALMSLTPKTVNRSTREKRVRDILQNNFDVPTIGRFVLGQHWKEASEKQRNEYMSLFEDMVVQTYTSRFEDYSGQTLKVTGSKSSGGLDTLVESQVLQKDGPSINLEWRIRNKDGALRVVDVVVEGVSMSVTQRADFASVIQGGGGNIEALLESLRARKKAAKG